MITPKEYCRKNPVVAFFSAFSGVEIHGFEFSDTGDYIYCVVGAWKRKVDTQTYHKLKIQCQKDGTPFIVLNRKKLALDKCIYV